MYHYRESGLPNIWLANGFAEHDTPYGRGMSIKDIPGLHRAIARQLVNKPVKLTGAEVRFLRTELGLSQSKLAQMLGNDVQSVAGWEKKGSQPKLADRFIRAIYREVTEGNAHIQAIIDRLNDADLVEHQQRITLERTDDSWRTAA
jgi:putative transcriptional regulator